MLRELDIFHREVKLNFNQSDKFTTNTGCFFTICVILVTIIQSVISFKSILYYESPKVTIDRFVLEKPGSITLNSEEFNFAIGIPGLNLSSSYISLELATLTTKLNEDDGTFEEIYTPLPWKRCSQDYMKNYSDVFYSWGLNEALCPNFDEFQLSGTYFNPLIEQLVISVTSCMNSTDHPEVICQSKDDMDGLFNNSIYISVLMFYSNTMISPSNYTTPVTKYLTHHQWFLNPNQQTIEAEMFVNQQDIITDDNLLYEGWNQKNLTTYQIDPNEIRSQPTKLQPFDEDGNYRMLNVLLRKSHYYYTTKRLYPKLQEGLASVGSVFSLAMGVFGIITAMYVGRAFALNMANQLYEFDFRSLQKKRKTKARSKAKKAKVPSDKQEEKIPTFGSSTIKIRPQDTKKEVDEEDASFGLKIPKKQTLKYHFGDFLLGLIPCARRKKDILIQNAVIAAEKEIELIEIVKKLHEFDRFKKLLLDEDEIRMLTYVQPPVISLQFPSAPKQKNSQVSKSKSKEQK